MYFVSPCPAPPQPPPCVTFYNLFYGVDHIASRLEPLLDHRFAAVLPMSVPNYKSFPTGELLMGREGGREVWAGGTHRTLVLVRIDIKDVTELVLC